MSLIAKKVGSTIMFSDGGAAEHVTLLLVDDCVVVDHRTVSRDGYSALVVAAAKVKDSSCARPQKGLFSKAGIEPRRFIREFRLHSEEGMPAIGTELDLGCLAIGGTVDVCGMSKGKGFAGPMKRHGFRGLEATHGVSISHRSHGSIGQRTYPSKVFKGKKMAGRMGHVRVTVRNLRVIYLNAEKSIIGVRGAVPGAVNGYVTVAPKAQSSVVG